MVAAKAQKSSGALMTLTGLNHLFVDALEVNLQI
jgi:hypothetical protein